MPSPGPSEPGGGRGPIAPQSLQIYQLYSNQVGRSKITTRLTPGFSDLPTALPKLSLMTIYFRTAVVFAFLANSSASCYSIDVRYNNHIRHIKAK